MFDLAAFDAELTQRKHAEQKAWPYHRRLFEAVKSRQTVNDVRNGPNRDSVSTGLTVAVAFGAAFTVLSFMDPLQSSPIEDMTYNGMNLAEFAIKMNLPKTDPYLIALFEELCMTA